MKRALAVFLLVSLGIRLWASDDRPPAPPREFRGLWVATVNNVDWPSREGLSTHDQQAELIGIMERASALHLNAIILQVRPDSDALYASKIEPWSEYLTGVMGRAPSPYYDPLEFAVNEAHRRGLELHAWFNPFRVREIALKTPIAPEFVSRLRPEMVRRYGSYLWLDPGDRAARDYALNVVTDVVSRYDIDGVHFDDYFYPYKEKVGARELEFPDEATWNQYVERGGKLSRGDWRRDNINQFIQAVYLSIKADKPWVKFGVSPFGIWRPKFPAQIRGFDAFDGLYADSRLWLREGWVDYLTPQLYWPADSKEQNFAALLKWWSDENIRRRHVWPGMKLSEWRSVTDGNAREVAREIEASRRQPGVSGNVLWHAKPMMQNLAAVDGALWQAYAGPALVPASPWLSATNPPAPALVVKTMAHGFKLRFKPAAGPEPRQWVLAQKANGRWNLEYYPGNVRETLVWTKDETPHPSTLAVAAVDRYGNMSAWSFGADSTPTAPGAAASGF